MPVSRDLYCQGAASAPVMVLLCKKKKCLPIVGAISWQCCSRAPLTPHNPIRVGSNCKAPPRDCLKMREESWGKVYFRRNYSRGNNTIPKGEKFVFSRLVKKYWKRYSQSERVRERALFSHTRACLYAFHHADRGCACLGRHGS